MNKWITALLVLVILYLLGNIVASLFLDQDDLSLVDKVVIIPLNGVITTGDSDNSFLGEDVISSTSLVKDIEKLNKDSSVKGIIFEINSPGGTAVASQEIADAIKKLNKPNYALIRDAGASGAYWIASATDKIIASPISVTGSIGVLASYLEFSRLFEKYGVNYERLVSGEYKDIGSPYKELTEKEKELMQKKISIIHEFFIKEVASNRNMSLDYIRNVSTGEFFLGEEAMELGLVDELGNRDTAVELMKQELNVTDIDVVEKVYKRSLIDVFLGNTAYQFGRGFAKTLVEFDLNNRFDIRT